MPSPQATKTRGTGVHTSKPLGWGKDQGLDQPFPSHYQPRSERAAAALMLLACCVTECTVQVWLQ